MILRLGILSALMGGVAIADENPVLLWPNEPPKFAQNAGPEVMEPRHHISNISTPSLSLFLPKAKNTGMAIIVCPGGAYRVLDWETHVIDTALYFNPLGVAVIGLKYRTSPPNPITKDNREIPLMDVKRAVRTVRSHAQEWGINPNKIGVMGFSAGANLVMTLAGHFDEGDEKSADPIERLSSRPDFVIGCSTWHWREKVSPFTFSKTTPPVFLVHATNDGVPDKDGKISGAPIELPQAIQKQLQDLGVPVKLDVYDVGGHGTAHLIPQRVQQNYPSTKWPEHFLQWIAETDPRFK